VSHSQQTTGRSASPGVSEKIPVGISACLAGRHVRYDGGTRHDRFLTDTLSAYLRWVPVCPEVEMGLPAPRPSMELHLRPEGVRLIVVRSGRDLTERMHLYAADRTAALAEEGICGFVLKASSPSCGVDRVKLRGARSARRGSGLFAAALKQRLPELPLVQETEVHDPRLRENWVTRLATYARLQRLWRRTWTLDELIDFHTAHKLLLAAHSPAACRELDQMMADAKDVPRDRLQAEYQHRLLAALCRPPTPGRHASALKHALGYFKRQLDQATRDVLLECIEDLRRGRLALSVPLTLLAHYARLLEIDYLNRQVYLNPHPAELAMRAFV